MDVSVDIDVDTDPDVVVDIYGCLDVHIVRYRCVNVDNSQVSIDRDVDKYTYVPIDKDIDR